VCLVNICQSVCCGTSFLWVSVALSIPLMIFSFLIFLFCFNFTSIQGYVAFMAISGILFTFIVRKNESIKHYFRVLVKWLIRLSGCVLIYNSFASPLVSTMFFLLLAVAYIVRTFIKYTKKMVTSMFSKKDKKA
jgi:hypothetical protein